MEIKDEYESNRNAIILFYDNAGKLLGGACYSPDNNPLINAGSLLTGSSVTNTAGTLMDFELLFENKDTDNPLGYYQITGSYDLNGGVSGTFKDIMIEGKDSAPVSEDKFQQNGVARSFEINY